MFGCSGSKSTPNISGTWVYESDDGNFKSTTTVAPNGSYNCKFSTTNSGGVKEGFIEGKYELKDEFLIDTMTKHSNTNAILPHTSKAQIVHYDDKGITLRWEGSTNLSKLRRERDQVKR